MEIRPTYLIMITTDNNNKYYTCTPAGDIFTVKYGRVGGHESTTSYPMSKWDSQINSKLKKGYVDRTDLMLEAIEDSKLDEDNDGQDEYKGLKASIISIIKRLQEFANNTIKASYRVTASVVTQAMVDKAQDKIDFLSGVLENIRNDENTIKNNEKSYEKESNQSFSEPLVKSFNENLIELFEIIPRKMAYVPDNLAKKVSDFAGIIEREQSLLDTMAGQVYKKKNTQNVVTDQDNNTKDNEYNILNKMGIIMDDTTDEDIEIIKKAMGDSADKFYKAWKVSNFQTEEIYQKFTKENNIGNKKLLCHGSKNQNWFNILRTGLKIRPSGVATTGAMWGVGCYWSNPDKYHGGVKKSIGYTSLNGYWTHENKDCGFIAFFEVALGESENAYEHDSKYYSYDVNTLHRHNLKAWSLFAHGNTNSLRNDEIIVYTDKQSTIRYLVEIR